MMKLIIFFILLIFLSCEPNKKDLLKKTVAGNNHKFWVRQKRVNDGVTKSIYYFDTKNRWIVFTLDGNGRFNKYNGYDFILIEEWNVLNDSIISIGKGEYKVISYNDSLLSFCNKINDGLLNLRPLPEKALSSYVNILKQYNVYP